MTTAQDAEEGPDVVGAIAWSALEKWGARMGTFVVFAVLSRYLGPADFGLVALASIAVELLTVLVDRGVGQAVIQRGVLDRAALNAAFWLSAGLGVVLTLVTFAAAPAAGAMLDQPGLVPVLRWLSLGFLFACLGSVPTALLQRGFQFKLLAGRRLLGAAAAGVTGVSLAVTGHGVTSLVAQSLVQGAIALVVGWAAVDWRPGLIVGRRPLREISGFTLTMTGIEGLTFVSRRGDDLLIGAFLGARALGYYTIGYRVLLYVIELLTSTISAVSLPLFARRQDDRVATLRAFYRATRLSAAIAIPAFAGLAVLADVVVPLAFGPQWRPSVPVMQVLAGVGMLQSVTYFDRGALLAAGGARTELLLTLVATIGNLAAFAIAVPFGIVAVAVAFLVRTYLFWPLRIRALVSHVGLAPATYLRQLATPAAGALVMALVVHVTTSVVGSGWVDLLVLVTVGVATYAGATALLSRSLLGELSAIAARILPSPARWPA